MASSKKSATGSKLLGVHFPDEPCNEDGSKKSKQSKNGLANTCAQKQLSRSNDNLASTLRKKAIQSNLGVTKDTFGKDRITSLTKTKSQMTKLTQLPVMRKSSSAQAIDISGKPSSRISLRAQSVQNICRIPVLMGSKSPRGIATASDMKRTSSTQNITNSSNTHPKRSSTNAMIYNAELLSNFKKEKKSLEQKISEMTQISEGRKAEVERLKIQLKNVQKSNSTSDDSREELRLLRMENKKLKEQLQENGISVEHFTDNEKLFLLEQMNFDNRNSVDANFDDGRASLQGRSEASETINLDRELRLSFEDLSALARRFGSSMDLHSLDRHNSLSVDRGLNAVSVADLRDRFLQMQETHYSTNEELQATLQELGDLQDNVNELSSENERLADEKTIILESLCTQTEKLENARLLVEHLKALLLSDSKQEDRSENECQLVALVKSAAEEREELLLKQAEFDKIVIAYETENRELQDVISALKDRISLEESKSDEILCEKEALESQLNDAKNIVFNDEQLSSNSAVDNQMQDDTTDCGNYNLKNKISFLEQEKSDILAQLQCAKQTLFETQDELLKLNEHVGSLNDELEENAKIAKSKIEELEFMLKQKDTERDQLMDVRNTLEDQIHQIQQQLDWISNESKLQEEKIQELDLQLQTSRQHQEDLRDELQDKINQFEEEQEEWFQFQQDLQMAVVVANDIYVEKQDILDDILVENQNLKEKAQFLLKEMSLLKSDKERLLQKETVESSPPISSGIRSMIKSNVDRDLALFRQGRTPGELKLISPSPLSNSEPVLKYDRISAGQPLSPALAGTHFRFTKMQLDNVVNEVATKSDTSKDSSDVANSIAGDVTDEIKKIKFGGEDSNHESPKKTLVGILTNKTQFRRHSVEASDISEKTPTEKSPAISLLGYSSSLSYSVKLDPLASLAKQLGGSKRNALLKWCQNKTATYPGIDITNFSSSWNDGMAFCALLHSYLPDKIPFKDLKSQDVMRNFKCAFQAAESVGIASASGTDLNDLIATERPDWQAVFGFVTNIYKHFEVEKS